MVQQRSRNLAEKERGRRSDAALGFICRDRVPAGCGRGDARATAPVICSELLTPYPAASLSLLDHDVIEAERHLAAPVDHVAPVVGEGDPLASLQ